MQNFWKTYDDITGILQKHKETLCQRLLMIEYFEPEITDNQSDNFLRMLLKNDLPFS